jgi:hypothetical protein
MDDMISTATLSKAATGIRGFDEITLGGLPAGRPGTPSATVLETSEGEIAVLDRVMFADVA